MAENEAPKLNPCPFCGTGEKVKLSRDIVGDPESDECLIHWSVNCLACAVGTHWDDAKERCIKNWNTRAVPDTRILIDALKKAHACATLRDDGTCDGCFLSEALEKYAATRADLPAPDAAQRAAQEIWDTFWSDLGSDHWSVSDLQKILAKYFTLPPDAHENRHEDLEAARP